MSDHRKGFENEDGPAEDAGALWRAAMAEVTPLRDAPAKSRAPGAGFAIREKAPQTVAPPVREGPRAAPARDLDKRTRARLERGAMALEAVIDLHGLSQDEAYKRLCAFLGGAQAKGMRCVLVITGKGRGGSGVLRARLHEWVDAPPLRAIVLRAAQARPGHGGGGAFYVLLRRIRQG